jgi:hypothetical protein
MSKAFLSVTKFDVGINKAALLNSITNSKNGKITGREVRKYILPIIEEAQQKLIKDFYNHAITKEINSGPSSSNSSGTLGGYGNLFSFIGFERGDNPTSIIDKILREKLTLRVRAISRGRFRISIFNAPSEEKIYTATPIPWATGASWAEGMEKGISNLGSFLYSSSGSFDTSRSSKGIQLKNQFRPTTFKSKPYVSKMLQKFLNNIIKF